MTDINYGILFTLELLHKYFTSQLCNDFSIIPSLQTQRILNGNRIIVKQYDNTLYAGIQMAPGSNPPPFIIPPAAMQLTFFLQLRNNLFLNYTNMPNALPSNRIYYFTNRNSNAANSKNFLSLPLQYTNATQYSPGDLATDPSGTVYQSILTGQGNAPSAATSNYWMPVDKNQYFSPADALTWMPSISTYTFSSPQSSMTVDVYGYNIATKDYTSHIISSNTSFQSLLPSYTLDLSTLSPGKYNLSINGGPLQPIYINDELNGNLPFAVIDICNDSSITAPYALLSSTNKLNSPLYSIYFLNRYSIWKYILTTPETGTITDNANVYKFTPTPANIIYSLQPIPLTEQFLPLSLTIGTHLPYNPIACPSPERLVNYQPNPPSGDVYNCSEIYLNY
jgi:hypothetical protein